MSSISGTSTLAWVDLYQNDTTLPSGMYVGQLQEGPNGKFFRYSLAGGSSLVVGNLLQSPAIDVQFNDMAVPAAVAAATAAYSAVSITNGTTTVNANDFVGATLEVSVTPALGEEYTIMGHGTATSGSSWTLYLDRPIRTAWTTSTKVTVRKNPWYGVIQSPATTLTGVNTGFAIYAITNAQYGWIQSHGIGSGLSDATSIIAGSGVAGGSGTAGAITLHVAGFQVIATAYRAAASGKTIPLFEMID